MNTLKGSMLSHNDRLRVLEDYVHRFTKDHKPAWSKRPWENGKPYPVQFASDADWLENTEFMVTKSGRLDLRAGFCYSSPTWPDNPELRKEKEL